MPEAERSRNCNDCREAILHVCWKSSVYDLAVIYYD